MSHVRSLVHRVVKNTPSLSRISSQNLRVFSIDIALVTLGIRTGYLLDLFSVSETTARDFGAALLKVDTVFKGVLLLFHTNLEQLFFVNVSLLHDRQMEARSVAPWTSFIYLTPEPQNVSSTPSEIHTVCQTILSDRMTKSSAFHTSISSLSSPQMIAFAGYLLEYPISYYPVASNQSSFLHDTPLEVYECIFIPRDSDLPRHSFMKFSSPGGCGNSSGTLVDMIERRFKRRLGQLCTEWRDVKVICDTRTLDRVAL